MLILVALVLAAQEKIEDKKAANGMTYALRVPNSYDPKRGAPAMIVLHGSNQAGTDYVGTIAKLGWLKEYILIGPDGEEKSERAGGHNFSESSAKLVKGVYDEVAAKYKISHAYVCGFSQGGYLTYDMLMQYPETFSGGIAMAGTVWARSEPSNWNGDDLEKRRRVAIAIVHGMKDDEVTPYWSERSHFKMIEAGIHAVRFWRVAGVGHAFALLPVPECVEWLDAMRTGEASKAIKEGRWRDVSAVAAKEIKEAASLKKKVEQVASAAAVSLAKKMKGQGWLDDFYAYREAFQFTDAAKPILKAYDDLRRSQEEPAKALIESAAEDVERKDEKAARTKWEEIVRKYPASPQAFYARLRLSGVHPK